MKKSIIIISLIALTSSIFAYSQQELDSANLLANKWIIVSRNSDPAAYNLDNNVLRQEIAAVAREIAWLEKATDCNEVFDDLTWEYPNNWACNSVEPLYYKWIVAWNADFRPEDEITKAESLGLLIKASCAWNEYAFDPSKWTSWQSQLIDFSSNNLILDSFNDYNELATRGWVFNSAIKVINHCATKDFSNWDIEEVWTFLELLFSWE